MSDADTTSGIGRAADDDPLLYGYTPQSAPRPVSGSPVETARLFRTLIEEHALGEEERRYVSDEVMRQLMEAGLFALLVPREFGGTEATPFEVMETIETLAYADGATAWSYMAPMVGTGHVAGWCSDVAAKAVFGGNGDYLVAGHAAPLGRATRVDDGLLVSGRFQFASGCRHASWVMGGYIEHKDGAPVMAPTGGPIVHTVLVPKSNARILGNWDVMGLVATGSYDFEVPEQVVSEDFVLAGRTDEPRRGGRTYRVGRPALTVMAHGAWPIGAARRSLDELRDLSHRKQRAGRSLLLDLRSFQRDFAEAEASLRSARAFLFSAYERMYEVAVNGRPPLQLRAEVRLAAANAVKIAVETTQFAYLAAGAEVLRNPSIIQRNFRDAHAAIQHVFTDEQIFVNAARVMLHDPAAHTVDGLL